MSDPDFEREAGFTETETVASPRRGGGDWTSILLVMGAVGAALALWFWSSSKPVKEEAKKPQEFRTTRQDVQSAFNIPPAQNNRLIIPPPAQQPQQPPQAVQPPIQAPLQPVTQAPVVDHSADDAEAERARAAREADDQARLNSQMMVMGGGAAGGGAALGGPNPGGTGGATSASGDAYREDDPNRRFAAAISSQDVEVSKATRNERIDALIPQGTMMRGVLETAINSDLPGMVRAKLSQDVYSFDGRRVLLPKDTMIVGTYRSGIARGQTRVLIIWQRALRADGTSLSLGSYGTDDLGRSGMPGEVDNHYLARFGAAAALSVVGGVSSFIAGLNVHGNSNSGSGNNGNNTMQQGQTQAQQTISQTMSDMANTALRDSINIPPTINVDQGAQIAVFVQRDLDFSSLYEPPEREALRALKGKGWTNERR